LSSAASAPVTEPMAHAEMTDEDVAEFRERLAEVAGDLRYQIRPRPNFTPVEVRDLLRECVTVVKPGEVLVIRMANDVSRDAAAEYQANLTAWLGEHAPEVKVAIVCGEELAVVETPPGD
jgi:hypothetical protein